jgi:hypothetical protein
MRAVLPAGAGLIIAQDEELFKRVRRTVAAQAIAGNSSQINAAKEKLLAATV